MTSLPFPFDDVILSAAVLQAERRILRGAERPMVRARSLARLKSAGLRDDASENEFMLWCYGRDSLPYG
ncbi:hypothetical protein SBA1_120040 [Candidatus Sulfotelmatobacter kueseliae]|uniref:Uncharacterized protein n=1 Tax=Candidatus Sulfotelmatobacter kueseliae TaxID=2042962 RepID=A0A2U3K1X6_9BACT|nr:hypothetical protein SBA1_120040 [Candidatus Sulfotelmatobacter kueseliae]